MSLLIQHLDSGKRYFKTRYSAGGCRCCGCSTFFLVYQRSTSGKPCRCLPSGRGCEGDFHFEVQGVGLCTQLSPPYPVQSQQGTPGFAPVENRSGGVLLQSADRSEEHTSELQSRGHL